MSNENLISESKEVAKYIPESAAARVYRLIEALNEAERKLESVVDENAALKSASSCLVSEYMMSKGTDSEFIACITPSKKTIGTGGTWDMWRHLDMVLDTTPATDAFLAEVRASGVEQLASLAGNEYQRYKSVGDRAGMRKWKSIVILCTDFAAQLRQGGEE